MIWPQQKRDQINQFLQPVFKDNIVLIKTLRRDKRMKSSKSESWEKFLGKKGNYLSEQQRRENNNVVGVCAVQWQN